MEDELSCALPNTCNSRPSVATDAKQLTARLRLFASEQGIDLFEITDIEPIHVKNRTVSDSPKPYRCGQNVNTEVAPDVFDPCCVLPDAVAVIIMAFYTYGLEKPVESTPDCPRGKIGPWTRVYPYTKQMSDVIVDYLTEHGYRAVHTNDLPYRALALKAGLGQLGRNQFIFANGFGSYLRFNCVVTDAPLETVAYQYDFFKDVCGNCHRCVDSCPVSAIDMDGTFHYDICLHELLQGRGKAENGLPKEYWGKTMSYLMRTGYCIEVCPRNKHLKPRTKLPKFLRVYPDIDKPDSPPLLPLVMASDEEIRAMLPRGVYQYGEGHVRQNAILALGQQRSTAAIPVLKDCLLRAKQENAQMAAWALGRIGTQEAWLALTLALDVRK